MQTRSMNETELVTLADKPGHVRYWHDQMEYIVIPHKDFESFIVIPLLSPLKLFMLLH